MIKGIHCRITKLSPSEYAVVSQQLESRNVKQQGLWVVVRRRCTSGSVHRRSRSPRCPHVHRSPRWICRGLQIWLLRLSIIHDSEGLSQSIVLVSIPERFANHPCITQNCTTPHKKSKGGAGESCELFDIGTHDRAFLWISYCIVFPKCLHQITDNLSPADLHTTTSRLQNLRIRSRSLQSGLTQQGAALAAFHFPGFP